MSFHVERVTRVRKVADGLTRRQSRAYKAAVDELKGRGCAAGGKRLAAEDTGDYPMCGRSLYADWRMFTVYPEQDRIVIVALARHTKSSAPVETLAEILPGLSCAGRRRSDQPPCCDDPADPPYVSDELAAAFGDLFGL